jgi:hypothetical protein
MVISGFFIFCVLIVLMQLDGINVIIMIYIFINVSVDKNQIESR